MDQIGNLLRGARHLVKRNPQLLLTVVGVSGTLTTTVLTARAAFRVGKDVSESEPALEAKDYVQRYWKDFVPPVVSGAATVACIIAANRVGARQAAALATAYSLSEKAFVEYRHKVVEKIGEKKEQVVRDEIAQDRVTRDQRGADVIMVGDGSVLCYDLMTGRYFTSSVEALRRAENELNAKIINDMYASLNEFWTLVGVATTTYGEEVGWSTSNLLKLSFSSVLTDDNRPVLAVEFTPLPTRGFYDFH